MHIRSVATNTSNHFTRCNARPQSQRLILFSLDAAAAFPYCIGIAVCCLPLAFRMRYEDDTFIREDEFYPRTNVSIDFTVPGSWRISRKAHKAEFKTSLVPTNGEPALVTLLSCSTDSLNVT
jgi:hypothetical protein